MSFFSDMILSPADLKRLTIQTYKFAMMDDSTTYRKEKNTVLCPKSKWSKIAIDLGHYSHLQIGGGEEEEQLQQLARKDLSAPYVTLVSPKDFFVSPILKNKIFKHYNVTRNSQSNKNDFHLGRRSKTAEGAKSPEHHKQPRGSQTKV